MDHDPIFEISKVLRHYTLEAYPVHNPKFAERLAYMKDIQEKAHALAEAFENTGEELAITYEDAADHKAYEGFTSDPHTGEYDSSFFRFAWKVIATYDPKAAKSNNALGKQIRLALAGWDAETWVFPNFKLGEPKL